MGIPVGINGFGRIGRIALRIMLERGEKFELRGINLRKADLDYMEYMVKYDSVFRTFHGTVEHDGENLIVNGHKICVFSQSDGGRSPGLTAEPSTLLSPQARSTLRSWALCT